MLRFCLDFKGTTKIEFCKYSDHLVNDNKHLNAFVFYVAIFKNLYMRSPRGNP